MSDAISNFAFGTSKQPDTENVDNSVLPGFIFSRAIVIQTLCDPSLRDAIADEALIKTLKNPSDYLRAPRNSVICRISTEGNGRILNSDYVCFPFFSSHVMMPVKAGEQIWIFFEVPGSKAGLPFWLSRIAEPLHVEDANFTHGDRRNQRDFKGIIDQNTNRPTDDGSGNFDNPRRLKFQNGNPAQADNATLLGDQSAFLQIMTGSKEFKVTAIEPVPRITKRPGDLVLQGSNNTTIRLGTEMGWDSDPGNRPQDSTEVSKSSTLPSGDSQLKKGLGAIDIVVGRGRYFQDEKSEKSATESSKKDGKSAKNSTRPYIEENVATGLDKSSLYETDKNVATVQEESISSSKGNRKTNPQEGDPDFLVDASRIYISTKSEIDKMLKTGKLGVANSFENPIEDKIGAAIAVKSDHVRIIARKSNQDYPEDISKENPQTNGTIRIVKEGKPNEDLATITIEADGTIQISGSKVFIGRKTDDGGAGTGPGPGESQPYVKYKQLEDLLNKTYDDLKTFVQKLQANFNANTTPGFGGPNPALIKSAADECTQFISAIDSRKSEIETLKSARIFGE